MPHRFATLWAAIKGSGEVLPWARFLAAVVGVIVLGLTVAVFVRHVWHESLTELVMAYVAMFVLLGLALLKIGGSKE